MYVDKKLGGVECVQTLSRLNRTYPGKAQSGTFVLDFWNEPEEVLGAFQPYYQTAELTDVSDPQLSLSYSRSCAPAVFSSGMKSSNFAKPSLRKTNPTPRLAISANLPLSAGRSAIALRLRLISWQKTSSNALKKPTM